MPFTISHLLVALQFLLLGALVLTTPTARPPVAGVVFVVAGVALGVWAVGTMRLSRLRVMPEPGAQAELVRTGPYRWLRHPMYAASLLAATGLAVVAPTRERLALFAAAAVVLVAKTLREERLLAAHFPDYAAYQRRTKRLVPFVW